MYARQMSKETMKSLVATNLHKTFEEKVVLEQESLSINPNDRMGLVGKNGCGKTTLIKILAGRELPDKGQILNQELRIGYLAQDFLPEGSKTLYEAVTEGVQDIAKALGEFEQMNENFQGGNPAFMGRYSELMEILTQNDGYNLREKVQGALINFNIRRPMEAKVSSLSGGETVKLALIKILITSPDILLLDEPTNHLDLQGNLRLRDFLLGHRGGYLIVSHDRDLLDQVTASTLELNKGRLKLYGGNYSFYRQQKELEAAAIDREMTRLSKEQDRITRLKEKEQERLAHGARRGSRPKDHDTFQAGFFKNRADTTAGKKAKELESRFTKVNQQLESAKQKSARIIKPNFKEGEGYKGKTLIIAKNVSCGYGNRDIVQGVNLEINFGKRIALFGDNGAGKTTLVKGLLGYKDVSVDGQIQKADKLNMRILDQNYSLVDRDRTVLENMQEASQETSLTEIRKHLARFLFTNTTEVNKKAELLSGGEVARLAIAMVVAMPIDLLVLDEPTNNLDPSSIEEIEDAISEFEGGIVVISHDLSFLKAIGIDQSCAVAGGSFCNLMYNPLDNEIFKKELLDCLQGATS